MEFKEVCSLGDGQVVALYLKGNIPIEEFRKSVRKYLDRQCGKEVEIQSIEYERWRTVRCSYEENDSYDMDPYRSKIIKSSGQGSYLVTVAHLEVWER